MHTHESIEEYRKGLIAEYEMYGRVNVEISREESAYLGRMIRAWQKHSRDLSVPGILGKVKTYFSARKCKIILVDSFDRYPKANAIFRFYIRFNGLTNLNVVGVDIGPELKRLEITTAKRIS